MKFRSLFTSRKHPWPPDCKNEATRSLFVQWQQQRQEKARADRQRHWYIAKTIVSFAVIANAIVWGGRELGNNYLIGLMAGIVLMACAVWWSLVWPWPGTDLADKKQSKYHLALYAVGAPYGLFVLTVMLSMAALFVGGTILMILGVW